MKIQGKVVVFAFVVAVACLASCTNAEAVFGDGSLNMRQHEKGRSLSKRSVIELFRLLPWIRNQFSRSSPDTNSTTEAPTPSPLTVHTASGLKTDIARMLTLNRQRRAPHGDHKGTRSRRSIQELRSVESFLRAEQGKLTDALRTLPNGLFASHHQHHHAPHGGNPLVGLNSILMPFGLQPGQNSVLFLHHHSQPKNNKPTKDNNATTATPEANPPASSAPPTIAVVGSPGPVVGSAGPVVGSAGPAISAPVVILVPSSGGPAPPSQAASTTESSSQATGSEGLEPRRVSSASTTPEASTTDLPATSAASTDSSLSASTGPADGTSGTESTTIDQQQTSTTDGSSTTEGSGTSEGVSENAREDPVYRFLSDDA